MSKRTIAAVIATTALLAGGGTAAASADPTTLGTCSAPDDLNCTVTVANVQAGDNYCQLPVDPAGPGVCHPWWPFANPTVDAAAAPPWAFPDTEARQWGQAELVVSRLRARVYRLRHRVHHMRRELRRLRQDERRENGR